MEKESTPEHPFVSNQTPARLLPKTDEVEDEEIHVQVAGSGFEQSANNHQLVLSSPDEEPETGRKIKPRETWDTKVDFLLSVIGFAVDLGNVWRFPYVCYSNGGGAFLIPYLIMYIFGGLPLFYMELALGQYQRAGCISVWKRICPMFKGIGFGICLIGMYVSWYYNTLIAWAVYYLYNSFRYEVPWSTCNNSWNSPSCNSVTEMMRNRSGEFISNTSRPSTEEYFFNQVLKIQYSEGMNHIGQINWPIAFCLFLVFVVVYFSLWKGVKTSGKAVWLTATIPYIVLITLLFRGVFLEGSSIGISYYLRPNFTVLAEPRVWTAAASQIFFSLGPGFGVILALASYNKFYNNCYRDALVTSAVNCLTSFLAGFVVFSVLGYMSYKMNKPIREIADEGPGLVFIAYPQAIATLRFSPFWAVIFFIMLITLGLDSTFGGLESVITAILDEWPWLRAKREIFVLCLVSCSFLGALPTTTYGGFYVLNWLDQHAAAIPLLFIVSCEAVGLCWFYGVERFNEDVRRMLGFYPGRYWRICWKYISPIFIFAVFIANCATYSPIPLSVEGVTFFFSSAALKLAWCFIAATLSVIPCFMIYTLVKMKGTLREILFVISCSQYQPINVYGYKYPGWSIALAWMISCSPIFCIPLYVVFNLLRKDGKLRTRLYRMITPTELPEHVDALQMNVVEGGIYTSPEANAFDAV